MVNQEYYKLGQRIRNFRIRSGKSQMELELEISASAGSLSRIENGEVNPTKETLLKLIEILNLNVYESTSLFGIALDPNAILKIAANLMNEETVDSLLQKAVDEIVEELDLLGAATLVIDGDILRSKTYQRSTKTEKINEIIGSPFDKLEFKLEYKSNYAVKTFLEKKIYITHNLMDVFTPVIPEKKVNVLLRIVNFKSGITLPMLVNGRCCGVIFFGKNYIDDFALDKELLQNFTNWVGMLVDKFNNK